MTVQTVQDLTDAFPCLLREQVGGAQEDVEALDGGEVAHQARVLVLHERGL